MDYVASLLGAKCTGASRQALWGAAAGSFAGLFFGLPGLVLGPLFEKALVQTSALGDGDLTIVFQRPLAVVVLALALALGLGPTLLARRSRRRRSGAGPSGPPSAPSRPAAVA